MLDFSLGELVLIALVALVIVGPKDLPVVMRAVGKWFGKFKGFADEFRSGFRSALQVSSLEQDLQDIHQEGQFIRDEAGNLQRVYDISDFLNERESNARKTAVSQENK